MGEDNTMGYEFEVLTSEPSGNVQELNVSKNPRGRYQGFYDTYKFEIQAGSCVISEKTERIRKRDPETGAAITVSETLTENPDVSLAPMELFDIPDDLISPSLRESSGSPGTQ